LGLLDDYPTRSGYLITPVVLWSQKHAVITLSPDEVASVHRIALEDIERSEAFDLTARDPVSLRWATDPCAHRSIDLPVPRSAGRPRHPRR
jgi:hypothetical protein